MVQKGLEALTRRELEVLALLADGYHDFEIAQRLWISVRTVNAHVTHILQKLDVDARHEAGRLWRAARDK